MNPASGATTNNIIPSNTTHSKHFSDTIGDTSILNNLLEPLILIKEYPKLDI